jgi:hypothetical protein
MISTLSGGHSFIVETRILVHMYCIIHCGYFCTEPASSGTTLPKKLAVYHLVYPNCSDDPKSLMPTTVYQWILS